MHLGLRNPTISVAPTLPLGLPIDLDGHRSKLAKARQIARGWANSLPSSSRKDQAASFTRLALETFVAETRPLVKLSPGFVPSFPQLDADATELAELIGRGAGSLPTREATYFLTSIYSALIDPDERGRMGAFYTPPALTSRLIEMATEQGVDWTTARVLDPASGGGAFLVAAAERMIAALAAADPAFILRQIETRLCGFELDPHAAGFGQNAIEIFLSDVTTAADRPAPIIVRVADTLEEPPSEKFDLVLGNPPYGRITLTEVQRNRFKRSLYGHANLYGVFTDIALRWTKPGGTIAYLTPTSFLSGRYYSALRELIASDAPPTSIDFVHARRGVFEDVLQETLLAAYRRGGQPGRVQIHYVQVRNEREADVVRNGTVAIPAHPSQPWLAPRQPNHGALIASAAALSARLADWGYSISTGPLVWNRHKSQLRLDATRGSHPLIWAESVTSNGNFMFRADKRGHTPYFEIGRCDDWLLNCDPCILVQRTTAKEQARRLIAAELPAEFVAAHGGVVVENHLNMIRPTGRPRVSPAVVAAFLNSDVADRLFRCINGSVAVSAFELEAIPLPAVCDMAALEALVSRGADRDRIESELMRLYGQVDQ